MKLLLRLLKIIGFLVTLPLVIIEAIVYSFRWLVTGKPFPDNCPLCVAIIVGDL